MPTSLDMHEVHVLKGTIAASDVETLHKLTACYKLLLLYHQYPYQVLNQLSTSLGSDKFVLDFLAQHSWKAEPTAALTLQLLGCIAGASASIRKGILGTQGFLGGMLGLLRAARYDVCLMTSVVSLASQLVVGEDAQKLFAEALGAEFSIINILTSVISEPATYRHLRQPVLKLLLCLGYSRVGQQALWKKQHKIRDALQAAMTNAQYPLSASEAKLATNLARELSALYLIEELAS